MTVSLSTLVIMTPPLIPRRKATVQTQDDAEEQLAVKPVDRRQRRRDARLTSEAARRDAGYLVE